MSNDQTASGAGGGNANGGSGGRWIGQDAGVQYYASKAQIARGRITNKLDELRNHRSDGVATTTDLIEILEILEGVIE